MFADCIHAKSKTGEITPNFVLDVSACKGYNTNDKKLTNIMDGQLGLAVRFM